MAFHFRRAIVLSLGLPALSVSCASAYRAEPLEPAQVLSTLGVASAELISLSLAQAQALAILRHPSLKKLRAERGLADAAKIRAESKPDPELSFSPFWIVPEAVLGAVASLRWEILPSGTKEARRGLAGALRESVDAQIAAAEWRVAQEARVRWIGLVRAEKEFEFLERALSLSKEARDFGALMIERGAAREIDVAVLELDFAEAERDLVAARAALPANRERLAEAIGLPPGSFVAAEASEDVFASLDAEIPGGDPDEVLLQRLPELREAKARYGMAERELELAHLGGNPKLALGPDVQRDADNTFLGGGATISIPSTDANRAAIAEASTRREIAARQFEEKLFEARAALAKARAEEEEASRTLAHHESSVMPRAKQTLEAAERAVNAGASDLLILLLARERALRAERAGLDLRAARAIAIARLESSFGPEPVSGGVQ